jgi:hypothetical protein
VVFLILIIIMIFAIGYLNKKYTGFAHYLKTYDGIFIMKYIVDNPLPTDNLPKIVLNGLKLISIEFVKIKLIDSHNFNPMPLSKFPSSMPL